jgi:hypothetical protein
MAHYNVQMEVGSKIENEHVDQEGPALADGTTRIGSSPA